MTGYLGFSVDWSDPATVATYDELPLWSAMAGLLLLEHLPLKPGVTVLDIGPGTGFPLFELAQRLGPEAVVIGLDPWAAALRRAQLKHRSWAVHNAHLVVGDAAAMPFPSRHFDLVVSNLGLNNFSDAPAAVAECARALKPDGILAITTNLQGHMAEFYAVFGAVLTDLGLDDAAVALAEHIGHRATVPSVTALFADAGLAVRRVERRDATMRFASGSGLLNHHFIKAGFLDAWKAVVPKRDRMRVFGDVEAHLNDVAAADGVLELTIPLAYIVASRAS